MNYSDVIIRVDGLGKKYFLHHEHRESYTSLRDVVSRKFKSTGRLLNPFTLAGQLRKAERQTTHERVGSEEAFWALKDVSFEIRRGDRVGIIGRNGAGKSTLLKILSRITEPTTGRVEIRGRVASLLEVGTGFHPELTGRENIYLNGAILGMTRREIRSKFDEIVDFAEVDKFLDTPVKRYSSGMYVRLAFSVAAHLEPEILVVDEVLAVGDANFQKKCLGKMQDVADSEGRTVLFVSHNMIAVKQLCNLALAMKEGSVTMRGEPQKIIDDYLSEGLSELYDIEWSKPSQRPGDDWFRIRRVQICNEGESGSKVKRDKSLLVKITYDMLKPPDSSFISIDTIIHLKTADGVVALVTGHTRNIKQDPVFFDDHGCASLVDTCVLPANFLNDTSYVIDVLVFSNTSRLHALAMDVVSFTAWEGERDGWLGKIMGVIRPSLEWKSEQLNHPISY